MRAFQLTAPGTASVRAVDDPDPRPGEVLVRVTGAGVCHSDLHILHAPDFVGAEPTLATAAACIGSFGQITAVGLGGGELPFRSEAIPTHLPWGTVISRPYGGTRRDLQEVVALAQKGLIDVHVERFDLADASRALAQLEQGDIPGRAVLVP